MIKRQYTSKLYIKTTILSLLLILVLMASNALAQDSTDSITDKTGQSNLFNTIISSGGVIGYIIIAMSLASVALIIEHFLTIRQSRLLPDETLSNLSELIDSKEYDKAIALCQEQESYVSQIIEAGLGHIDAMFGFFDMQNAMQEASERAISKLHRKLEYLTFIASTAPMMGLLGTVTGMITAFNKIAATEGTATPSQLAGGISEALVTTCLGLIVAIPTMFFVALFRNRIESYIAEAEIEVERIMGHFRKTRQ